MPLIPTILKETWPEEKKEKIIKTWIDQKVRYKCTFEVNPSSEFPSLSWRYFWKYFENSPILPLGHSQWLLSSMITAKIPFFLSVKIELIMPDFLLNEWTDSNEILRVYTVHSPRSLEIFIEFRFYVPLRNIFLIEHIWRYGELLPLPVQGRKRKSKIAPCSRACWTLYTLQVSCKSTVQFRSRRGINLKKTGSKRPK